MDPVPNPAPAAPPTRPKRWLLRKRTWALVAGLVAAYFAWDWWGFPLWVSFRLDPDRPYLVELGRGSGWHGLNTVRVDQDGTVTLHRQLCVETPDGWEYG